MRADMQGRGSGLVRDFALVSVRAERTYYEPARPFLPEEAKAPVLSTQHELDDVLDLEDATGKRLVTTRLHRSVTIREENAAAANAVLPLAASLLERAVGRDEAYAGVVERVATRTGMAGRFVSAYRQYCWRVVGIDDLKLAPFHLLATEGGVHVDRDHLWHMETLRRIAEADGRVVTATPHRVVDVTDPASEAEGISWWEELTGRGGEGMVVKPLDFVARGTRGLTQPALKCRGPEYLRIIYGPEYTLPSNLERLRKRGLSAKRSLALREFALGIEGLERFVRREPLRRVHECAFAVLALESEPVDPRL
jgi:protein phosphatase